MICGSCGPAAAVVLLLCLGEALTIVPQDRRQAGPRRPDAPQKEVVGSAKSVRLSAGDVVWFAAVTRRTTTARGGRDDMTLARPLFGARIPALLLLLATLGCTPLAPPEDIETSQTRLAAPPGTW